MHSLPVESIFMWGTSMAFKGGFQLTVLDSQATELHFIHTAWKLEGEGIPGAGGKAPSVTALCFCSSVRGWGAESPLLPWESKLSHLWWNNSEQPLQGEPHRVLFSTGTPRPVGFLWRGTIFLRLKQQLVEQLHELGGRFHFTYSIKIPSTMPSCSD